MFLRDIFQQMQKHDLIRLVRQSGGTLRGGIVPLNRADGVDLVRLDAGRLDGRFLCLRSALRRTSGLAVHLQDLLNQDILRDAVLDHVAIDSLLDRFLRIGETLVTAQDDDAVGQLLLTNQADEFETVHLTHLDVRDNDIHRRPPA